MRRKDREQSEEFGWDVLETCPYAVLSTTDDAGLPYSIPVSAAVAGGAIYFHSAKHGTKSKLLRAHPAVCLVGVRDVVPLPEAYSTEYASAIVRGTIATDDHCGPLFEGTDYRTKKIKIEGGMADFNGVRFPINPMIGVIGTAPAEGAPADGFVGNYGGNMDNKLITKGTRLYFPVRVPGALLQMGDVHATMGDAELCGTGIEIAAQITVRVNVLKNFELHWPVLETFGPAGKWYVNASAQEYNEALICASKEMQRLLMNITGWDAVETYMYMSVQSDVEISQGCKPCEVQLSLRIGTPKLTEFPPLVG